jgi:prepilin-type N-terminal cleavage/methylation domain-containing protein
MRPAAHTSPTRKRGKAIAERPTSNLERRTSNEMTATGSTLDVGRWTFDVRLLDRTPLTPTLSPRGRGGRRAFSLLEVVVALAILAIALTACLGVVELGIRSARDARDQSRAQEIAESVMGLIASGVLDVNGVAGEQSVAGIWSAAGIGSDGAEVDLQNEEDAWSCSVNAEPGEQQNLLRVTITVTASSSGETPPSFTLVRWMLDPTYLQQLSQNDQTNAANATNSSGSSNSNSSSSSSQSSSSGNQSGSAKTGM